MPRIKELSEDEKPREKLIKAGPEVLSDFELLAIILRSGTKEKNVLELSREIIEHYSTNLVSRKTYEELLKFKGVGSTKATQIVATFELSRRIYSKNIEKKVSLCSSKEIYDYVKCDFSNLTHERVMTVFVNTKNIVIRKEFMHKGTINYSIIEPRDIIKRALSLDASGIFLVHNHPSGDSTPSQEDIDATSKLKQICENMNIRLLDHIIIGDEYYSFFDNDNL